MQNWIEINVNDHLNWEIWISYNLNNEKLLICEQVINVNKRERERESWPQSSRANWKLSFSLGRREARPRMLAPGWLRERGSRGNRNGIKRGDGSSHVPSYGKEGIPLAYECHDHRNYNDSPLPLSVLPSPGARVSLNNVESRLFMNFYAYQQMEYVWVCTPRPWISASALSIYDFRVSTRGKFYMSFFFL